MNLRKRLANGILNERIKRCKKIQCTSSSLILARHCIERTRSKEADNTYTPRFVPFVGPTGPECPQNLWPRRLTPRFYGCNNRFRNEKSLESFSNTLLPFQRNSIIVVAHHFSRSYRDNKRTVPETFFFIF